MREEIIKRIEEIDMLSHVDIIHALKSDKSRLLFYDEKIGLALKYEGGTAFALPFSKDYEMLYEALKEEELICVHSDEMSNHYIKDLGYRCNGGCYTFSYQEERIEEDNHNFRLMRKDEIPFIQKYYNASKEYLERDIENKNIICLEENGDVKAFSGFHSEGSMGLLTVIPEYRGKGLGKAMEAHIISEAIKRGWIPFCNVYTTNEKSISLQHSLGLKNGSVLCHWVWKES